MVLGIVGVFTFFVLIVPLLALILGLVAASERKSVARAGGSGLAMARAGWILGSFGVAGFAVLMTLVATDVINLNDDTVIDDLEVGDCVESDLDDADETVEVRELPVIDCDEPHDAEVVDVVELNRGRRREYPSPLDLGQEATVACLEGFEDYHGAPSSGDLVVSFIVANEDAWDALRGLVVCLAFDADGDQLDESVAG